MKRKTLLLFVLPILFLTGMSQSALSQGEAFRANTPINADIPGFYEYLPETYNAEPDVQYPVYIFVHGTGATGNGSYEDLQKLATAFPLGTINRVHRNEANMKQFVVGGKTYKYIYICPQFRSEPWYSGIDYKKAFNDIIDYVIANYRVDSTRIYLNGNSMGGGYIMDYLGANAENPKRVAASIITSGNIEITPAGGQFIAQAGTAMWFGYSIGDAPFDTINTHSIDHIRAANPNHPIRVTAIEGGTHNSPGYAMMNPAYTEGGQNIYQWLLNYKNLNVVPVTGLKIGLKLSGATVVINWSSYGEQNSSHYLIERGADAKHFKSIGSVTSKNSPLGASYNFTDNSPDHGLNYYRIRHEDRDGKTSYSKIVPIDVQEAVSVRAYPNPVTNMLTIETAGPSQRIRSIQIFDYSGKLVKEMLAPAGSNPKIDVSNFPKGYYIGKMIGDDQTLDFKFIKK